MLVNHSMETLRKSPIIKFCMLNTKPLQFSLSQLDWPHFKLSVVPCSCHIGQRRTVQLPPLSSQLSNSSSGDELSWKEKLGFACQSWGQWQLCFSMLLKEALVSMLKKKTSLTLRESTWISAVSHSFSHLCVNLEGAAFFSLTWVWSLECEK